MFEVIFYAMSNQNVNIFYMINVGMDNCVFDFLMPLITNFGSIIAWIMLCGIIFIFGGEKGKRVAILGLAALFISNGIVYILKFIVAEPRPFMALPNVDLLVSENGSYSFPSGHTASSFAAAVIIGSRYKFNFKGRNYSLLSLLIIFAGVVGFSRVYVGVHYPLDVFFGAIIGILSAFLVLKREDILIDRISSACLLNK